MAKVAMGDMANHALLTRLSSERKADLTRLSQELTTGLKADLGAAISGDFGPYAGIERALRTNEAYSTANKEAVTMLTGAQIALESAQSVAQALSPALLTASSARDVTLIGTTAQDAVQKFGTIVSRLNTQVADRYLFGGAATDRAPLASAEDILADVGLAIAGLTTAADIETAIDAWFDTPGGGFETIAFMGSASNIGALIVSEGESIEMDVRADDQGLRDLLKGLVLAGVIDQGALAGDPDEQAALIEAASLRVLASDGDVTALRARIGAAEAQVEDAQARNSAAATAYELARADLVGADPYETATRLEAVYSQIETLYTITARISQLRFSDYL